MFGKIKSLFEKEKQGKTNNSDAIKLEENSLQGIKRLEMLVGLEEFKALVNQARDRSSFKNEPGHYVFIGDPGTGKTMAANLMGEIFKEAGILSKGHVVQVTKADLSGKYIGESSIKTKELCEKAIGGILFVEEAYQLDDGDEGFMTNEVIDSILLFMEEHNDDTCVILSGYDAPMEKFIYKNVSLASRCSQTIHFPEFNIDELVQILKNMMEEKSLKADSKFFEAIREHIVREKSSTEYWGNAYTIRTIFDRLQINQSTRLAESFSKGETISDEDKMTIVVEDVHF